MNTEEKINLEGIERFYFIGIGGIGMSALARYFHSKGFEVAGYDKTPSPLTAELEKEGMHIHFEDLGEAIPTAYRNTASTLVIYTPAIPVNMAELVYVKQAHKVLKRSEVLGLITQASKGLGVAGTHGKTTTSTLLAYVLSESHIKASAFLGGIASNFNSNVLVDPKAEYVVVEADEFDRSFMRLSPFASIITAMDPDHLDIYGTEEEFHKGFQLYADKHEGQGFLVHKYGLPLTTKKVRTLTYGIDQPNAHYSAGNLRYDYGCFLMDVKSAVIDWKGIELGLPGIHNAENALAVIAMCLELGLSEHEIRAGLAQFKGVKRRFETQVKSDKLVYIDDYAHHPMEIAALVSSIRLLYPNKHISGIFQPHLFSRTRDFLEGFCSELGKLDEVILMPIYPAREEPIPGITSDKIVERIGAHARLLSPEQVLEWSLTKKDGVVLTIGAGDIDRLIPELTKNFKNA